MPQQEWICFVQFDFYYIYHIFIKYPRFLICECQLYIAWLQHTIGVATGSGTTQLILFFVTVTCGCKV